MTGITTQDQVKIEQAIAANIPGLSTDAARTLLGVMEGLLMGMNPTERATTIAALSTSASAASAVALTNYAAEAERLQNEGLLNRRVLEERRRQAELATDPAQVRRNLLHILRTENQTSGRLLAAAIELLGGSSANIAEAWARHAAQRSEQNQAATMTLAFLMSYDAATSTSSMRSTMASVDVSSYMRISSYSPRYEEPFWSRHYQDSPYYSPRTTWGDNPEQTFRALPPSDQPLATAMVQQERQRLAQRLNIPLNQVTGAPPIHYNGRPVTLERAVDIRRATNADQVRTGARAEGDNEAQPGTARRIISAVPGILSLNPETRQASRNEAVRGATTGVASIIRRTGNLWDSITHLGSSRTEAERRQAEHERTIQANQTARSIRIWTIDNVVSPVARNVVDPVVNNVVAPVVGAVNNYVVAPVVGAVNDYVVAPVASAYNTYVAAPIASAASGVRSWFRRQYDRVVGNTPQPEVVATGLPTGDQVVVAGPSSAPSAAPTSTATLPAAATVVRQDTVAGTPTGVCTVDNPHGDGSTPVGFPLGHTRRDLSGLISQHHRRGIPELRQMAAARLLDAAGEPISTAVVLRGGANDGTVVAPTVVTAVGTGTGAPVVAAVATTGATGAPTTQVVAAARPTQRPAAAATV